MKKILLIFLSAFAFVSMKAAITWNLSSDGTLTISGTDMPNYGYPLAPWDSQSNIIKKVEIKEGVTNIGDYAFNDCKYLTSITIPNSVTNIGRYAFHGCSGLISITIPNSVTSIGDQTFYDCSSLTSITIPNSVTSIGVDAFRYCYGLTSVTIGNSVTSIGNFAFASCHDLTSITIPNSVTNIGKEAFSGCKGLSSVTIGNSVASIGEYAFVGCTQLRYIYSWNTVPPITNNSIFTKANFVSANTNHVKLFVPEGAGDAYRYATGWREIVNIFEMEYTTVLPPSNPTSITDAAPTVTNGYYKENTISYIRESSAISEDNYASFCLPFAVDATDAQFKAVYVPVGLALYNEEANTLRIGFYKTNEILPAGTPFLAKLAVNDKVEIKNALPVNYSDKTPDVKNSVIRTFDYSEDSGIMNENMSYAIKFSGTYTRISPANANTFNTDGSVGPSASVVPFRAYIDLAKNGSNAKILSLFNEESEATGIKLIESVVSDRAAYNLAGQRVSPLKTKGVMIINGKKYIK